ncbi:MAG TPA: nitrite reductase small subunit NirD [Rhodocyclaceae bacterium]|nr:nitrite reductase small subunit NirD [Rhodocyclaceae bacterium]HNM21112.1 nitrite reductase small subunit NirD [Rhodocyclaceae bacterium]HNM81440.1 nitrite reductase small subunit NirD [Rhodocyclaceae bacterium]HNP04159.1 nitrite reductase small subunit NirD [Rhodocyclaceae bacterium]
MSDWKPVCSLEDIPRLGSRVVRHEEDGGVIDIAIFRTQGEVFALRNKCPHKGGPLSEGIVHGKQVTCPLHGWKLYLETGEAVAPDVGCARRYPVKVEDGQVFLSV